MIVRADFYKFMMGVGVLGNLFFPVSPDLRHTGVMIMVALGAAYVGAVIKEKV